MQKSTIVRTGAVGAVCALAGGAIGIAGSSASSSGRPSPSGTATSVSSSGQASAPVLSAPGPLRAAGRAAGPVLALAGPMLGFGPLAGADGPPVHSAAVVPNEKGGFDTVTMDRGKFSSLSGDQLTITEGTKSATYKSVTLTIPSNATVRRNEEKAALSDLKAGDEVLVVQGPNGTVVAAHDAQHAGPLGLKLRATLRGEGPPGEGPPGEGAPQSKPEPPPAEGPPGSSEKGSTAAPEAGT